MKRILAVAALALALVAPVQAAPDPADLVGVDPYTTYVVARILPNGSERVLGTATVDEGWTNEQIIRATALEAARQNRTNNPSWRIVIYGPIDPPSTWYTDDDRIWDSAVNL